MSIVLNPISLPQEFTKLLRSNLSQDKDISELVQNAFNSNPGLKNIFATTFAFLGGHGDLKHLLKTMGWLHFRDRVCSLYLNRIQKGSYPYEVDSIYLNDLLDLEQRLALFTVQSVSRSYLLGFYIHLHNLKHTDQKIVLDKNIFEILKIAQAKSEKIDWLVFMIWHWLDFFGFVRTKALVEKGASYTEFYQLMDAEQKKTYLTNALQYGFSIGEDDLFKTELV